MKLLQVIRVSAAISLLASCDLVFPLRDPADAPSDAPPRPTACTTPATAVSDGFSDFMTMPLWRETPNGNTIVEANGSVTLGMVTPDTTAEMRMPLFLDLRGSSFSISAGADRSTDPGSKVVFELESTDYDRVASVGHTLRMALAEGNLLAEYSTDNTVSLLLDVPYSNQHAHWRIAQDGPTTRWSTSPDGRTFNPMFDFDFPFSVAFVRPRLATTITTQVGIFGFFNQLNGGQEPTSVVCAAEELKEDFSILDPILWGRNDRFSCTTTIDGGQLLMSGEGLFGCNLGSSGPYDLIDHTFAASAEVQLDGLCTARLEVLMLDGGLARFDVNGGQLRAMTVLVGEMEMQRASMTYDPNAHRFWRFAGGTGVSGGELTWQVSPDGVDYSTFIKVGDVTELGRAQFNFHLEGFANAGACNARFDNVNL